MPMNQECLCKVLIISQNNLAFEIKIIQKKKNCIAMDSSKVALVSF